ncbi:PBS lyase HEAT domain protein repeat-containing protein [Desulfatibacillum aliphaticivorans]|uniref:PBS lyase HEAT domain protein repeat-containing protein n=1 Tax=Desulfatibacillum aliphaticivorans TaxID=218208 RepID=B8FHD5_DESAL|nr:HEAT repeat domain-containing protein [Desulfatibacillum aliphaticivorans]ACL02223.1 PBS lyase HEAT domain protein repeat-containing protein [Desulfatibacillum aliphaticivorans]
MARKQDPVEIRLKILREERREGDPDEIRKKVREALKDKHQLVVALAAKFCEEYLFEDLEPDLIKAYNRFLANPVKKDPNCRAKEAIVRALAAINCQDVDFFIEGLKYRQLEPIWNDFTDTAVDVRVSCAMGLASASYPRALVELAQLLNDPEDQARIGAVRAIAITQPLGAEALLRFKALLGDSNPDVASEALAGLLQLAPQDSKEFVHGFFQDDMDLVLRESLALSLGESKTDEALEILQELWENEPYKREQDLVLLRGAVLHRSEKAFDWLIDVISEGDRNIALFIIEELSIYSANEQLAAKIQSALAQFDDEELTSRFVQLWQ